MLKKTVSKTLKTMLIAPIGVAMTISSAQVSAENTKGDGHHGNHKHGTQYICLHLPKTPHHPDPQGSYVAVKMEKKHALHFDDASLKTTKGLAIARAPDLINPANKGFGDWVSTPLTGSCLQHGDEIQCSFGSISGVTTLFPAPVGKVTSSIEVGSGQLSFVYNMDDYSTIMSTIGAIDVFYYDANGKAVIDTPLPKTKRIREVITNVEKVSCGELPHPEIAPFYIDGQDMKPATMVP